MAAIPPPPPVLRGAEPPAPLKVELENLVSYPAFRHHEEALSAQAAGSLGAFDVMAWMSYLDSVDDALDLLRDPSLYSKNDISLTSLEVAGQTFRISSHKAHGVTHTPGQMKHELNRLITARILIGERSVSLLPGSYKLWKHHLNFLATLLEISSSSTNSFMTEDLRTKCNALRIVPYLIFSSAKHEHYQATVSAFERALVRLHKMPAIWLHYASIVALYNPTKDPTAARKIYDRALVALPASQHDRIWEEYLAFVTGILPKNVNQKSAEDEDWTIVQRRGLHKVKYGRESPLVAVLRKRGWGYHQVLSRNKGDAESYMPTVPTETAMRILRRHTCFDTTFREDLATLCITRYARYGEGAAYLLALLNNEGGPFISPNGTTRHELWIRFANVCTAHPLEAKTAGVDFDKIVRAVLKDNKGQKGLGFEVFDATSTSFGGNDDDSRGDVKKHKIEHHLGEMQGTLWTRLAEFHIKSGDFELARSVYEEALDEITRVRDFSLVFDAYVKFEEGVIEALMELMDEDEIMDNEDDQAGSVDKEDLDILVGDNIRSQEHDASAEVELAISRAEHLTSRRPLLLNRVLLRQNPHNVGEWLKRSQLFLGIDEVDMATLALEEALKSVSSRKAVNGPPSQLVLTLVETLETKANNVEGARSVLERVCTQNEYDFVETEDLAQCHAAWVELELRQENWDKALNLARRAVGGKVGGKTKAGRGLSRSLRLWNLLFDLEESLGTVQTTKDAYDRALDLKVVTPSHVLNYAAFLREKKYFEESFAAYERGLGLFPFPHAGAAMLWKNYLTEFLERYDGSKTPRVRELFDRCLADCPAEESPQFFLKYATYEESHGLTKRALGVYEKMCTSVPDGEMYTAYRLYIAKASHYLGATSARPIYEAAIAALEDKDASNICLEYAKMETGLREVDRARTVLVYGAQMADPRVSQTYWKAWHEFEVSHGNEETFREMLRVKRSVQAAFSTVNYNAADLGNPEATMTEESAMQMLAGEDDLEIETPAQQQTKSAVGGFVAGKRKAEISNLDDVEKRVVKIRQLVPQTPSETAAGDDDEIELDDDDEENEEPDTASKQKAIKDVSEKSIHAAVL